MLTRRQKLCVLHIAALRDEEAMEALRLTTQAVAAEGVAQVLIALDDGRSGDASAWRSVTAEISLCRCARLSAVGKLRVLQLELAKLSCERTPSIVHLHGLTACLVGWQALKGSPLKGRVVYSPHWTPVRLSWAVPVLARLLQAGVAPGRHAALAGSSTEARMLSRVLNRSVEVLPPTVNEVFFAHPRKQAPRASIAVGGGGADAVELASRLCVLFNSREPRVPFAWLGRCEPEGSAQLVAANVQVLDVGHDEEMAQALSRASLFLHLSAREQALHALLEAMAAGLPCLVSDTQAHRAVIRHGETGYLCASEHDFIEKITILLRDPAERERIGDAAREEAQRRFTLRHFQMAVLRAYGLRPKKAIGAADIDVAASAAVPRVAAVQRVLQ